LVAFVWLHVRSCDAGGRDRGRGCSAHAVHHPSSIIIRRRPSAHSGIAGVQRCRIWR
jgi:hypothetical protein